MSSYEAVICTALEGPSTLRLQGVPLGVRAGEHARCRPEQTRRSIASLLRTAGSHDLRPRIGLQMPLSRASDALKALEHGEVTGKAVLVAD